ncbi:CC0125/CC1285 family lipoprotein [Sulfitobacter sp. JL08]|uniref:CC0125/CC1285 family lipoprotein n=1 Tax=Sulfitobacter sp. JL08 TaxID=2070369 RepID=UPI0013B3A521|nr:hypothetical protein [Sulfitobacter sp. JL08]
MKFILVLSTLAILAACSTPYQETGLAGGVEATMIAPGTAQISVKTNAYTNRSTAYQFALLKAAETTLQQGYGHFQIVSQDQYAKAGSNTTYNSYTGNFQTNSFSKPRVDAIIQMFKGKKPSSAPANVFDATEIANTLGPQLRG